MHGLGCLLKNIHYLYSTFTFHIQLDLNAQHSGENVAIHSIQLHLYSILLLPSQKLQVTVIVN